MVSSQTILDTFRAKKVLVTGHTGFKGAWMLEVLRLAGAEVTGIALEPEYEPDLFTALGGADILEHHHIQDIRDLDATREIIVDTAPDFLFHLAAQPLVLDSYQRPVYTYEVNLMGTIHVLEAIREFQQPCTSVFITTDKVYENLESEYAYTEDDKLGGYDPYSASKATCEIAISSYVRSFFGEKKSQNIATARAGNVIGGGDMAANRLVPDIYRYLRHDADLDIRYPDAVRPWQHVIEPVWAYLYMAYLMAEKGQPISSINIGPNTNDTLSVRQVIELFLQDIDHRDQVRLGTQATHHEAGLLMLDISRAASDMGWTPLLTAEQAIRWTADWYMSDDQAQQKTDRQIKKYLEIWDHKHS